MENVQPDAAGGWILMRPHCCWEQTGQYPNVILEKLNQSSHLFPVVDKEYIGIPFFMVCNKRSMLRGGWHQEKLKFNREAAAVHDVATGFLFLGRKQWHSGRKLENCVLICHSLAIYALAIIITRKQMCGMHDSWSTQTQLPPSILFSSGKDQVLELVMMLVKQIEEIHC